MMKFQIYISLNGFSWSALLITAENSPTKYFQNNHHCYDHHCRHVNIIAIIAPITTSSLTCKKNKALLYFLGGVFSPSPNGIFSAWVINHLRFSFPALCNTNSRNDLWRDLLILLINEKIPHWIWLGKSQRTSLVGWRVIGDIALNEGNCQISAPAFPQQIKPTVHAPATIY